MFNIIEEIIYLVPLILLAIVIFVIIIKESNYGIFLRIKTKKFTDQNKTYLVLTKYSKIHNSGYISIYSYKYPYYNIYDRVYNSLSRFEFEKDKTKLIIKTINEIDLFINYLNSK